MDAGNSTSPNDLPYLVWGDGCDGLAQYAIQQPESVSDNAAGLSNGGAGPDLSVPSGSEHGHLSVRSLCCQTHRVVLLVRAAVARILRSRETTRCVVFVGFVRAGDSDVAVGGKLEVGREVGGRRGRGRRRLWSRVRLEVAGWKVEVSESGGVIPRPGQLR